MQRNAVWKVLALSGTMALAACGGGDEPEVNGADGESDGYPSVEMEAGGGSVTDSTGAGYP